MIHPLAFLAGDDLVAAACLRKIRDDEYIAGVLIRSADGLFRERIDVNEGEIFRDGPVRWELELLRVGTRQTTAVVRLNNNVVARINGDTTSVELSALPSRGFKPSSTKPARTHNSPPDKLDSFAPYFMMQVL